MRSILRSNIYRILAYATLIIFTSLAYLMGIAFPDRSPLDRTGTMFLANLAPNLFTTLLTVGVIDTLFRLQRCLDQARVIRIAQEWSKDLVYHSIQDIAGPLVTRNVKGTDRESFAATLNGLGSVDKYGSLLGTAKRIIIPVKNAQIETLALRETLRAAIISQDKWRRFRLDFALYLTDAQQELALATSEAIDSLVLYLDQHLSLVERQDETTAGKLTRDASVFILEEIRDCIEATTILLLRLHSR